MCVAKIEQYSMKCRKQCKFFANGVAWCTIPCDRSQYCLIKKRKIFFSSVLPWGAVCVRSQVPDQIQYSSNEGCWPGRWSTYEMIFTFQITTDPASVVCQPCFVKNITIETDHIPFPSIRYQWSTHPLCASLACLFPPRYPLLWGWS